MKLKKLLLVIVVLPLLWAGFQVSQARNVRRAVLNEPDAKDETSCNGVRMTNAECELVVIAKTSVSALPYFLLNLDFGSLWAVLYVLAGLAGVVMFYWLLAVRGDSSLDFEWNRIIFRLLLGAGSGFICYLLVKLPVPLFGPALPTTDSIDITSARSYAFYESLEFFPVLAGLFLGTFFEKLKEILTAQMDRLNRLRSGSRG